jgi:hypothetical protein
MRLKFFFHVLSSWIHLLERAGNYFTQTTTTEYLKSVKKDICGPIGKI